MKSEAERQGTINEMEQLWKDCAEMWLFGRFVPEEFIEDKLSLFLFFLFFSIALERASEKKIKMFFGEFEGLQSEKGEAGAVVFLGVFAELLPSREIEAEGGDEGTA
ncbi:uncharacterized protein MONOS_4611 [Monocercomonoides exilis]|uniref:uncharacterized protein n=1 Tax=Monocercomonoides exilis TaxID=2049356 RepID=UPI00355A4805|nr:hypothetical protein MONOS_4611 [Monocercomonoides exilis]|eukprot:MONOS_4611.1-p1 / transcript=MONOS_4611.1 / gene=MONOS_4611 / organism=Monocercomonoides_exilis_PA203 / gene_product=unspecified product / transcript_product=unspecified product / location=Mono_scaffold00124:97043-97363(+) / protein_length=107 / sequence_SO=supercontig / SO=protein_coding / is_pseudo=false